MVRYRRLLPCLLPVLFLLPASLSAFTDDFSNDPTLGGSGWELYIPLAGLSYSMNPAGWWRVTMPENVALDHWSSVDNGSQLRRTDPVLAEDFRVETRVNFIGSGDPNNPTWPPVTQAYQAGIMIYFARYNMYYWGFYTNTTLRLERSGANNLCQVTPNLQELSLQVKRIGSLYYFSYRASDADPWTLVCTQTYDKATYAVNYVGLIFKSWSATIQQETFEFDYFTVDKPVPVCPVIGEVKPDPQAAFAEASYDLQMPLLDGYPTPTWSLVTAPAGATINAATGAIQWLPAPADVGTTFPFEVKAENACGPDTETFDVLVHPLETDDPFGEDPLRADSPWELYDPVGALKMAGNTAPKIVDGAWRFVVPVNTPGNVTLDHWSTVDRGIQLRRDGLPEDFIVETRVNFLGSGSSDPPRWPPVTENYHAALMVYFGPMNVYYWGLYTNTTLRLERSGVNNLCQVNPGLQELSLQIKKVGSLYSFSYRADDADAWTLVCTQALATAPQKAGLIFKTWANLTQIETFDFDYLTVKRVPPVPPEIAPPCFTDPDVAWIGMPYIRPLKATGYPLPDVSVGAGPAMTYSFTTSLLTGWTPDGEGTVAVKIDAVNPAGASSVQWDVEAMEPSAAHDDEFDEDPVLNTCYWEFHEPLKGVSYSIEEGLDGTTWWRLGVPILGAGNQTFDHWSTLDRAVQLRHAIGDLKDYVIETRLRVDPDTAPPSNDEFHVGLMLYFGRYDILYFGAMQVRTIGGRSCNISVERSGVQNILGANAPNLLAGAPVRIRIEKTCDRYNFFLLDESLVGAMWQYIATYTTAAVPTHVGLVMKTWGGGLVHLTNFDFDYFDILYADEPEPVFPVVTSVEPSSGPVVGGTAVTIKGEEFKAGAVVRFGGVPATGVVVNSSSEITCTTPAHAAGVVAVEVMNSDCTAGSLAGAFTYTAGPVFIRGDTDGNGQYIINDGVQILERLFAGRESFGSNCEETGDVDGNGLLIINDAIWMFNFLFAEGPDPAPPAYTCGRAELILGCEAGVVQACR